MLLDIHRRGNRLYRLEWRGTREDSEAPEHALLLRVESVVAPIDRCAERLVARQHSSCAAGQQPETIVEIARDSFDG